MGEHNSIFPPEFFKENRRKLQTLCTGTAPVVITANGLLQSSGDTAFPFRQDSSFWYLTGIDEPDVILVIDKDKEYLIVPNREAVREVFDGAISVRNLAERSGISEILDEKAGWKKLEQRLKRAKHVATLASLPQYVDKYGFYANPARSALVKRLKTAQPALEVLDLRPHLAQLRMIKQPAELVAIQAAVDLTIQTLSHLHHNLSDYGFEYEIEADITRDFRRGRSGHAFEPIVAAGVNACTLHNVSNKSALRKSELIVLDVGAQVSDYAADITRTYALGKPTKRQLSVAEAVIEVQDFAKSLLKPGVLLKDYEQKVSEYMGEKLRALGLIKEATSENIRKYYPHATSHFLGLDVHDVGDYTTPLKPGMVLTVEPGIYIPAERLGVRIEDDVLITENGHRVLSSKLPRVLQ